MALGHLEKARDLYREEIDVRESFSPAKANDWESRRELAGHYAELAALTVRMGDLVEGQGSTTDARRSANRLRRNSPTSGRLRTISPCRTTIKGPCVFRMGGDPKAARAFHRKALDVFRKRARPTRRTSKTSTSLAQTLYYEATCALHSGRQRRGRRGLPRMPEDLQRAGHRAQGQGRARPI